MATSIHIPKPLLDAVDRKARALKMSRNRLIVRALERELTAGADWSPGFFEQLKAVDPQTAIAVDELLAHAVAKDAVLVTANLDDMDRVPGITVEDWSAAPPDRN